MSTVPRKPHSPRKHALALGLGALLGLGMAQPALGWSVEEAAAPYKGSELKVGTDLEFKPGAHAWFVPEPGRYHFFHPETGEAL